MTIVTQTKLLEIINANRTPDNVGNVYMSDEKYQLVSKFDRSILKTVTGITKLKPFRNDFRDCDDFARTTADKLLSVCPGRAFGTIWTDSAEWLPAGSYHAANIYIDDAGILWHYEPQSGKRYQQKISGKRTLIII
ncbi:MAG: hypothetical protein LBU81_02765 [Methanosarcinales archaeon]|jgi:uncharacterized protein YycO|nr:hypothetical protein [Methanosarcinales archaeon]